MKSVIVPLIIWFCKNGYSSVVFGWFQAILKKNLLNLFVTLLLCCQSTYKKVFQDYLILLVDPSVLETTFGVLGTLCLSCQYVNYLSDTDVKKPLPSLNCII